MLGLIGLWLHGCGASPTQAGALREAVYGYADGVRWGHIGRMSRYIPAKQREDFARRKRAAYAVMKVHDVELRSVDRAGDRAVAELVVTWSRADNPVLATETVRQVWRYADEGWEIVSQRSAAGATETKPAGREELFQ
jgi:hypothetical protein